MKPLTKVASAIILGILATALGGAGFAQADSHHHPTCDNLVANQAPYSGKTVTVPAGIHGATMYLKISNQHVAVPAVSEGETYTPASLSTWPLNQNGKPQSISHVDYCLPDVPPTTEPPTETTEPPTETTEPPTETTEPPTETTEPPTETTEPPTETTEPPTTDEPEVPSPGPETPSPDLEPETPNPGPTDLVDGKYQPSPDALPSTGSPSDVIAGLAAALLLFGTAILIVVKRPV